VRRRDVAQTAAPGPKTRPCPGCRAERHPTQFTADSPYCQGCRDLGPQFPVAAGEASGGEEGEMATRVIVMEKRACVKGCGKMLDPRGAHKHEEICAGVQGGAAHQSQRSASTGAGR